MTEVEKARDALLNCIKTIEAASPTMTDIGKSVLGGRLWGSKTITQAQAAIAALDEARGEGADERQAAIVAALRDDAQRCDCFARSEGECACGAWDTEPGERSYKRKGVEDIADWIASGEWRR